MTKLEQLFQQLEAQNHKWQEQEFNRGKIDGQCGYQNENTGAICPSPYYHAGYVCGIHERLLTQKTSRRENWRNWELLAEVKDARFPLSSPIKFTLIAKTAGELNGESSLPSIS